MKKYKQILEAIHRGINLALDSFEDHDDIQQLTHGLIKNKSLTKEYLLWLSLIEKMKIAIFESNNDKIVKTPLTDNDILMLPILSRILGIKYKVHDRAELDAIIKYIVGFYNTTFTPGKNPHANLNWLDVSNIDDMSWLFYSLKFNGDISEWDVSHVENMKGMFQGSTAVINISNWDVSSVIDMAYMFRYSNFNSDISKWNLKSVRSMYCMFYSAEYFNQDISNWVIDCSKIDIRHIFYLCNIDNKYKPKFIN